MGSFLSESSHHAHDSTILRPFDVDLNRRGAGAMPNENDAIESPVVRELHPCRDVADLIRGDSPVAAAARVIARRDGARGVLFC